ncbi:YebC/PmpR family DNA-binding transcriptional regulator [Patescibacteria group bacterium]|nr:YebC/PmpR family DNA-binding transcriptional regulator [Patescibacteria group bacterium]
MSGHSKWNSIKRQKGISDSKRSAVFTKYANNIVIAAKNGSDPESNFSLRMAVDKAKKENMPKDSIEKAIKRGSGELGGAAAEELIYEGFGPSNTQFIVKCLTDNKNRSVANIRHIFAKHGGSLGAVSWNFEQKGVIKILNAELNQNNFEELELTLIDCGALDIIKDEELTTIFTKIENLQSVNKLLEEQNIKTESAEIEYIARETIDLPEEKQEKIISFEEALDGNEDVADYYSNIK